MDVLHNSLKWIDYNRGLAVGAILAVCLSGAMISCQPKTAGLIDPARKVTAAELSGEIAIIQRQLAADAADLTAGTERYNAEVEVLNAQIDAAADDLESQMELRRQIIEQTGGIATAFAQGGLDWTAGIGALSQVVLLSFAGGATYDNVRKRKLIKDLKAKQ